MKCAFVLYSIIVTCLLHTLFSCAQEVDEIRSSSKLVNTESIADSLIESRKDVYNSKKREALSFLANHKDYSDQWLFLLDMRIPSGKNRFFIHDLDGDSVRYAGLVAHGSGSVIFNSDSLIFSNIPESFQSSLGKYRIGAKYSGTFGKSYKLHGLDSTNSNAFERYIVLHPYSGVPENEQNYPIIESLGCPMVSESFMQILYDIVDHSNKHILMIMYY